MVCKEEGGGGTNNSLPRGRCAIFKLPHSSKLKITKLFRMLR